MSAGDQLRAGLDELFVELKAIVGDLPAQAEAKREEYQKLLLALGKEVASGALSLDAARYELRQAKNGLIQAIGSIGLDLWGKRKAALDAAIRTALNVLLRVAAGAV